MQFSSKRFFWKDSELHFSASSHKLFELLMHLLHTFCIKCHGHTVSDHAVMQSRYW